MAWIHYKWRSKLMIRLFLRLLGIKDFNVCASCETLKEQLAFERSEKKQLTETLLSIVKPKVIEAAPIEMNQIAQSSAIFSRRRAALEAKDRQEAQILTEAKHIGKPDIDVKGQSLKSSSNDNTVESLEDELGIKEG